MNNASASALHARNPAILDLDALRSWTCSPERLASDGRVLSWSNPLHPGYPYDEATALFAHLFRWQGDVRRAQECAAVVRRRLERGWLGRDGTTYVFDTALALSLFDDDVLVQQVVAALEAGEACRPVSRPGHWSEEPGPHLLKCAFWLARVGELSFAVQWADQLVDCCFEEGRFRISPGSEQTYLHSHCYALEGLLGLIAWLRSSDRLVPRRYQVVLDAGAQWLARVQHEDGSLPDYIGRKSLCSPSDVLAQAIRLWTALDPVAYALPLRAALGQLAARQNPETGGIVYHATSADECSWVAAFALQACAWTHDPPGTEELRCLL